MSSKTYPKKKESIGSKEDTESLRTLILYNDDYNLYDFVIDSLVEVCKHNRLQAEQCTMIAHHKGQCDIKNGILSELKPMKDELTRRGLSSVIISHL